MISTFALFLGYFSGEKDNCLCLNVIIFKVKNYRDNRVTSELHLRLTEGIERIDSVLESCINFDVSEKKFRSYNVYVCIYLCHRLFRDSF